jgi:hypothetical protein
MTYQVSGFKSRPSYEEILEQQQEREDSDEQIETTAMMVQPATNESSNTTDEGSSSSAVEPQPKHGRPQYLRSRYPCSTGHTTCRCLFEASRGVRREETAYDEHCPAQPMVQSHTYEQPWYEYCPVTMTIMF